MAKLILSTAKPEHSPKDEIKNEFLKKFTPDDSVMIFTAANEKVEKFGNAIHRDKDLLVF